MSSADICTLIAIVLYLVGMLLVGAYYSKKNKKNKRQEVNL